MTLQEISELCSGTRATLATVRTMFLPALRKQLHQVRERGRELQQQLDKPDAFTPALQSLDEIEQTVGRWIPRLLELDAAIEAARRDARDKQLRLDATRRAADREGIVVELVAEDPPTQRNPR